MTLLKNDTKEKQQLPKTASAKKIPPAKRIKENKADKIALQNILFGTNEKKLMVSDVFLNNMTLKHISKHMKAVNVNNENLHNTKSPDSFFKYYENVLINLDELIKIEPYCNFKNPVPSVFKRSIIEQKSDNISAMLVRAWKHILHRRTIHDNMSDDEIAKFDIAINNMLSYSEEMNESHLNQIDEFYKQVHGEEQSAQENTEQTNIE